jgi:hypothetical protein
LSKIVDVPINRQPGLLGAEFHTWKKTRTSFRGIYHSYIQYGCVGLSLFYVSLYSMSLPPPPTHTTHPHIHTQKLETRKKSRTASTRTPVVLWTSLFLFLFLLPACNACFC